MGIGFSAVRVSVSLLVLPGWLSAAGVGFRVATYNVENYLLHKFETRRAKPEEARTQVVESIALLAPEVLALQEVGGKEALEELRSALSKKGFEFPYAECFSGWDPAIGVAVLSKLPFTGRRFYTNETFLAGRRRQHVSRGIAELTIQVTPNYQFTLITAHLKSRRQEFQADEAEVRLEEAKVLRSKVDACLARDPEANLIVLGDLNDTVDSESTRAVIGRGRTKLVDTRPAEGVPGSSAPNTGTKGRAVTWTEYYAGNDTYSRVDFILLSRGMARELVKEETLVLATPQWGEASDHRPLVAAFVAEER